MNCKVFQRLKLVPLGLALMVFKAIPAQAASQTLVYDVYASGIHVLDATIKIDTNKANYDVTMQSRTKGFLGALVPWQGLFESRGWAGAKGYAPELHKAVTVTGKDETETKEYTYTRAGGFQKLSVQKNGKPRKEKFDPALAKGTTDALTATLNVLQAVADGKNCEGSSAIFDGQRRFKQVFVPQGHETLTASRYNVFSGDTAVCTVEVVPDGGAWHKKPRGWLSIQEQGRQKGALPTMWVGKITPGAPAIPVKIRIVTSYGTLFLHLAQYKNDAKVMEADKRK